MINQQLQDWVKEQLQQGVSKDGVRQMLRNTGWQDSDIDQVLSVIEDSPNLSNIPPPAPGHVSLIGPWNLFKKSFVVYRERLWIIFGIYFLPLIIIGIPLIAIVGVVMTMGGSTTGIVFMVVGAILILIIAAILGGWTPSAVLYAIKDREERIGIKESYRRSRHLIGAMLWVGFLTVFIVLGGTLLLIIPGIIFYAWFCFATSILVAEDMRGMDALMKSKEYVRGRWWGVLGRLLFIQLILLVGTWLIPLVIGLFSSSIANIIRYVVSLLSAPIVLIYTFLMYENLRDIKGINVVATSKKGWFIFYGVLGGLIIPLGILATVVLLSLGSAKGLSRDTTRSADLSFLQIRAELYYNDHNRYPLSLDELVPYSNSALPTDPTTHAPYSYTTSSDGSNYKLCAITEANVEKCVDKNGSL